MGVIEAPLTLYLALTFAAGFVAGSGLAAAGCVLLAVHHVTRRN